MQGFPEKEQNSHKGVHPAELSIMFILSTTLP
jgi:hypothetical protein